MKKRRADTFNWRITPDILQALPLAKKDRSLRSLIIQNIIVLAVGVAAFAGLVFSAELFLQHENIGPLVAIVIFLIIPICVVLMVLNFFRMLGLRQITLTPETVMYRRRRLGILMVDWTEPLVSYRGVQGDIVRTGKDSWKQVIELVHAVPNKTIRLCASELNMSPGRAQVQLDLNEALERYARVLHLPALVPKDDGTLVAVPPEQLVQPVGALIREGVLTVTGWEETPPGGLEVEDTPDGKRITFPPRRRKGILALEGFLAVLFIAAYFMVRAGLKWNEDSESPLVLLVVCAAAMVWELFFGRRLYVAASSLRSLPVAFGKEWHFRERSFSLREIRSVTIPDNKHPGLETMEGDQLEAYVASLFRRRQATTPVSAQQKDILREVQQSKVIIAAPGKTWIYKTEHPEHARWIRGLILMRAAEENDAPLIQQEME